MNGLILERLEPFEWKLSRTVPREVRTGNRSGPLVADRSLFTEPMAVTTPKVFASYSHDSEAHKDWVLTLATRLVANGVNVLLDQWDLTLGSDLPHFIESGLSSADR